MKGSCQRVALLAGVSISTLGLSSPAFAEIIVNPGIGHVDTTDPVQDNLVICERAPGVPTSPCVYGVQATGTGSVSAVVNGVETGRIEQIGISLVGDAQLEIISDGMAEIAAHATASARSGLAQASASINDAIFQAGSAPGNVTIDLTNEGTLLIDAAATANGGEFGAAHAFAIIDTAIAQWADSTNEGSPQFL